VSARADKTAGFSLVEMLTVLVIISLMTGVVVLSLPREKPAIEAQGAFLAQQFDWASQNSIISGQPQAFGFYKDAYYFYEFRDGDWEILSETTWPDDLSVQFYKDDIRIETPKEPVPMVVFEPLGLSTQFDLLVEGPEHTLVFSSEGDGKINMETRS